MAAGVAACLISSLLPLLVALAAIAGYDDSGVNATPGRTPVGPASPGSPCSRR
jgi:hypothetical protein